MPSCVISWLYLTWKACRKAYFYNQHWTPKFMDTRQKKFLCKSAKSFQYRSSKNSTIRPVLQRPYTVTVAYGTVCIWYVIFTVASLAQIFGSPFHGYFNFVIYFDDRIYSFATFHSHALRSTKQCFREIYCNGYIRRPIRCINSYNVSLFIIKRSACFGLFCPSSGVTFCSCISQLV